MPERPGAPMSELMHNLKHGPHHKDRTHKQEVAIAMKYNRMKKGKKAKRKSRSRG